ncbi:MAG: TonB-dependent receptor [Pseudomonadota bacterium]
MGRLSTFSLSVLMTSVALPFSAAAQDTQIEFDDEIIVRGVNIPDEKRATAEISNVLTDVKLQRTGDADIAGALRRVTGLSLSQGKFVVVRGLNERYSNLTLNGSPLPSPEPLRRVAPLDLFPTSIISNVLVQKTFSPEYSGEFGGGLIELRTKAVPDESFLEFKTSIGLDLVTTGSDGLTYDGGQRDFLGFDDGIRNFPDPLEAAFAANPGVAVTADNFSETDIRTIGASFPNSALRVVQEDATPPNHGFNVAAGTSFDLNSDVRAGIVGNLGYARNFQTKIGEQGDSAVDGNTGEASVRNADFDFESLTETVLLNGLVSGGLEVGDNHEFNITGIFLRKTQKEARERVGIEELSFGGFDEIFITNLEFFENQVWSVQGSSDHVFDNLGGLSIKPRIAYSEAFRDAPFETEFTYVRDANTFLSPSNRIQEFRSAIGLDSSASEGAFGVRFSKVEDTSFSGGIDLNLPITLFDRQHDFKLGYAYTDNERDYRLRRFGFRNETGLIDTDPLFFQRIDFLLADRNIGEQGGFELAEFPDDFQPQAYQGSLTIHGAYAGLDLELGDFIRLSAGVRYEQSEQLVDNFSIAASSSLNAGANGGNPACPGTNESCIDEEYFLPAVTATWNFGDNLQLRGAFSQTVTRPQFQELGAAFFTDTDRDISVFGNPFLVNTEINNFDARLEWYFGREQFITVGGFYKDLTNPIEESFIASGDDINVSYINAPSATLFGIEFEYEQRFYLADLIGNNRFVGGKDLVIGTNLTWSDSEVSADGTVTFPVFGGNIAAREVDASNFVAEGRRLQGQSEWIVNGQIGLEDEETRSRAFLLVNWSSARIRQVGLLIGAGQVPDAVERLPLTLDFVYAREFEFAGSDGWQIEAKVQNILGDNYNTTAQGTNGTVVPIDVYDLGQVFSASLTKRF